MKVYRLMDIGTAKPAAAVRAALPHHLIDVADPWESFSAAEFVTRADAAVVDIHRRGKPIVAVGGTVLYLKCFYEGLFEGPSADPEFRAAFRVRLDREGADVLHAELTARDPEAASRIHRNDVRRIERALEVYHLTGQRISDLQKQWETTHVRRPDWDWRWLAIQRDREENNHRCNARVRKMLELGLFDEVRRLADDPRPLSREAKQAVGYRELLDHFAGRCALDEAVEKIKIHTRRLAKHQRTWLRRFEQIHWLPATADTTTDELLAAALIQLDQPGDASV